MLTLVSLMLTFWKGGWRMKINY